MDTFKILFVDEDLSTNDVESTLGLKRHDALFKHVGNKGLDWGGSNKLMRKTVQPTSFSGEVESFVSRRKL